jgi:hypothetical protein
VRTERRRCNAVEPYLKTGCGGAHRRQPGDRDDLRRATKRHRLPGQGRNFRHRALRPGHDVVQGATPGEHTIAADCEAAHVILPHDRGQGWPDNVLAMCPTNPARPRARLRPTVITTAATRERRRRQASVEPGSSLNSGTAHPIAEVGVVSSVPLIPVSTNRVGVASKQVWDSKRVVFGAKARETWWGLRGLQVLAGIGSAGLVVASLVIGAPASAATVNGTGSNDQLRGTAFSDTIRGFGGGDRVRALAGADLIGVGSGFDRVQAGRGDDIIRSGTKRDFLNGGQGDDIIRGGTQHDFLFGGRGADTVYGDTGHDEIEGGTGSDVIFGGVGGDYISEDGPGADTIHGGLGNDTVILQKDGTPDTVTCGRGHDSVYGAIGGNAIAADCEEVHVGPPPCGCEQRLPVRPPSAEPVWDQLRDTRPRR